MVYVDELLMLTIGLVLVVFIYLNLDRFRKIPHHKIIFTAYIVVLIGWFLTVLEGFILPTLINILEHICYMLGSFLLLYWVIRLLNNKKA